MSGTEWQSRLDALWTRFDATSAEEAIAAMRELRSHVCARTTQARPRRSAADLRDRPAPWRNALERLALCGRPG